jgi:hypothetical protein
MTASESLRQQIENTQKWPKKAGKADYLRFLKRGRLTRAEAIRAKCYECVAGEDNEPCRASLCPLITYCQWSQSGEGEQSRDTEI